VRGRKTKPTAVKELEGNPGKRALNHKEPKPENAIPVCPPHIKGVARTEWNRITVELHALKIISRIDRAALVAYCQAWADYVKACGKITKEGEVIVSDKGGLYQNPWVSIKNSSLDRMVRISAEFGMTPSSRARVKVDAPSEEDEMTKMLLGTTKK
jgi:P27 family predicted phage terminase small subunit